MNVIITGGSGLIGQALTKNLVADGHNVVIVSRNPEAIEDLPLGAEAVGWKSTNFTQSLEGSDAVVNLAGANIAGEIPFKMRWTPERKQQIVESRVKAGKALTAAIKTAENKPKVLVQSSAVGIYGPMKDELVDENYPDGNDFLAQVGREWEDSTQMVESIGVRWVIIRTGLVLSDQGGIFPLLKFPFTLFAGGPIGSGRQYLPWIHMEDEVNAIRFLIENQAARGVFNLSAPNPVTSKAFGKALGKAMKRPSILPAPEFALKLMLGEVSTLALDGQRVVPTRLQEAGFNFKYDHLAGALDALLHSPRVFRRSFMVNASLEDVAAFHNNMGALKKLTPFPIIVQLKHIEPIGEGSQAAFNIWFGPVPIPWLARHHSYDPINGFTDTQDEGPFTLWVHQHSFINVDGQTTKVIDEITSQYGKSLFSGLVSRMMWLTLPILFAFRAWQTKRLVKKSGL
jgi:uncharacterized protein